MLVFSMGAQGGCGTSVSNSPDNGGSSSGQHVARLGDTITLNGNGDGEKIAVTVVKVLKTATSDNEFETPSPGKRYFAVRVRVVNKGTAAYKDSMTNGAKAVDAAGQNFDATMLSGIKQGALLDDINMTPGAKALGYIVFEVPKRVKIRTVQFGADSGFADIGEWKVA